MDEQKTRKLNIKLPEYRERDVYPAWFKVEGWLEGLEASVGELMDDPEFKRIFGEMSKYCNRMLYDSDKFDIEADCKLTVYQEIKQ